MADIPLPELKRRLAERAAAPEMSLADTRAAMDAAGQRARLDSRITVVDVCARGCTGQWLKPADAVPGRAILYLHGGAFVGGSCRSHRPLAAAIAAAAGIETLILEYRLAPEHPWPAAEVDAFEAYRHLLEGGIEPGRIALVGDSAGGNLAMATLLRAKAAGVAMPGACVLISPWIDLGLQSETVRTLADVDPTLRSETLAAYARQYLQGASAPDILGADLSGLPPVLIQAGGDEILAGDSMRLDAALAAAGNCVVLEVWPGLFHVWHAYAPWLKEGRDAIARVGEFLQQALK